MTAYLGPVCTTVPRTMPNETPAAPRVYIDTVGCQMNVLDSELVIGALKQQGYALTDQPDHADVLLFNTCSVRERAEEKTYSAVGRVVQFKRDNPDRILGVIGCMAQKDGESVRDRVPEVDLVVGTGQLAKIPALIREIQRTRQPQYALSLGRQDAGRGEVEASFESYDPVRDPEMRSTPFQAYVRIQIGCDKFCTYCVVPSTRGPEQSRPPQHILQEVKTLVDQGCKEVTFIGQTVNSYRYDHGDGRMSRLSDLIYRAHGVEGLERIKFVTNFPKDMSNDLLDAVRDLPKAVKYLHVPAQSGCDEVLKRMKRLYTIDDYWEMLNRSRERIPGVMVSSDFIVGFCGESEASFQKTLDFCRAASFKNSYIFKYSERSGTKAAERFPDDVPELVKRRRNKELLEVQDANSLDIHRMQIGKTVEVLVEGPSRQERHRREPLANGLMQLTGHTMHDLICCFDGTERLIGQTLQMQVEDATGFTLYGRVQTTEVIGGEGIIPVRRPRRVALV